MIFKKSLWFVYALVTIFSAPALLPLFDITSDSSPEFLAYVVGNSFGMLGIALLFWSLLLGNRFFNALLSDDLNGILNFHKWLGKYGVIFIVLHPVLEMFSYLENWLWIVTPEFTSELEFHITLGRIALALYFVIWITSAILRSKLKYRPWLYIHYLTYPMVFLSLQHIEEIGTYTASNSLLGALRIIALGSFLLVTISRLLSWAGFFKNAYKVVDTHDYTDDIFTVTLAPMHTKLTLLGGQYMYIQTQRFGESHPYSVLHSDKSTGNITFGIKAIGRNSKSIRQLTVGNTVRLDGPYGIFTRESKNTDAPRAYYAGGVGITPFVDSILDSESSNISLLYSVKNSGCVLMEKELSNKLGPKLQIFTTREQNAQYTCARICKADIEKVITTHGDTAEHYICGSKEFMKSIVDLLHSLNVSDSQIFTEEFSN